MRLYPPLLGALLLFAPSLALAHGDHGALGNTDFQWLKTADQSKIPQSVLKPFELPPVSADKPALGRLDIKAYVQGIYFAHDPKISALFIEDTAYHALIKEVEPELLAELFNAAASFVDLEEILVRHAQMPDETASITKLRSALTAREGNHLLKREVSELISWSKKFVPELKTERLARAVYEWEYLTDEETKRLTAQNKPRELWALLPVSERYLRLWVSAKDDCDSLLKKIPTTPGQVKTMRADAGRIWNSLNESQRRELSEHLGKSQTAVDSIVEAKQLIGKANPAMGRMLQRYLNRAQDSGSVDGMLGHLGQLFDNAGATNAKLNQMRPAPPSQKLSSKDRKVLATMLKSGLLSELEGTKTGENVRDFYKKHPLKLVVEDMDSIAVYRGDTGVIGLGEKNILEYLKDHGFTVKRLMTDRKVFDPLVDELAATFVHEATHQKQHVWREKQGLPPIYSQSAEIEAMSVETLFFMEKRATDKSFERTVQDFKNDYLIDDSLAQADRLSGGFRKLDKAVRSIYYSHRPSLEGEMTALTAQLDEQISYINEEVERRKKLTARQRFQLETRGTDAFLRTGFADEHWQRNIKAAKPDDINAKIAQIKAKKALIPEVYAKYRQRYDAAEDTIRQGRLAIASGKAPRPSPGAVPSPALPG